jgi:hypothetical protein
MRGGRRSLYVAGTEPGGDLRRIGAVSVAPLAVVRRIAAPKLRRRL